jgi:maltose/moltooligosaccharide transporter
MEKRKLSFWQIWNMSFGFLGIQMGFALQNSNVSRIFQTLGANIDDIPILWVAAPMTGLIIQLLVIFRQDLDKIRTKKTLLLPISGSIIYNAIPSGFAAGMLWIMDASINVSMEPFRALLAIIFRKQRTMGFAMQSFFIIGAYFCKTTVNFYLLGVQNTAPLGVIPIQLNTPFILVECIYCNCSLDCYHF